MTMNKFTIFLLIAVSFNLFGAKNLKVLRAKIKLASLLKEYNYNELALKHYERLAEINHSFSILSDLGILYKENGNTEEARKILEEAVKKRNDIPQINLALGKIYFEKEEYEKAKKYLSKVNSKEAVTGMALIENRKNNYREALEYYKILVNKYGEEDRRINLAILYEKLNEPENAEKELLLFYENSKDKYFATKYLIRFYKKHNRKEKLKKLIKKLNLKVKKRKMRPLLRSPR